MKVYIIYVETSEGRQAWGVSASLELTCQKIVEITNDTLYDAWFEIVRVPIDDIYPF